VTGSFVIVTKNTNELFLILGMRESR
jgi:hypothetical protein